MPVKTLLEGYIIRDTEGCRKRCESLEAGQIPKGTSGCVLCEPFSHTHRFSFLFSVLVLTATILSKKARRDATPLLSPRAPSLSYATKMCDRQGCSAVDSLFCFRRNALMCSLFTYFHSILYDSPAFFVHSPPPSPHALLFFFSSEGFPERLASQNRRLQHRGGELTSFNSLILLLACMWVIRIFHILITKVLGSTSEDLDEF